MASAGSFHGETPALAPKPQKNANIPPNASSASNIFSNAPTSSPASATL